MNSDDMLQINFKDNYLLKVLFFAHPITKDKCFIEYYYMNETGDINISTNVFNVETLNHLISCLRSTVIDTKEKKLIYNLALFKHDFIEKKTYSSDDDLYELKLKNGNSLNTKPCHIRVGNFVDIYDGVIYLCSANVDEIQDVLHLCTFKTPI